MQLFEVDSHLEEENPE